MADNFTKPYVIDLDDIKIQSEQMLRAAGMDVKKAILIVGGYIEKSDRWKTTTTECSVQTFNKRAAWVREIEN